MGERCETCRFATPYGERNMVVCRRWPAFPLALVGERFDPGDTTSGYWPRVGADDWCGEYKAKR